MPSSKPEISHLHGSLNFHGTYTLHGLSETINLQHKYILTSFLTAEGRGIDILQRLFRVLDILESSELNDTSSVTYKSVDPYMICAYGADIFLKEEPVTRTCFKKFMHELQHKSDVGYYFKAVKELHPNKIKYHAEKIDHVRGKIKFKAGASGKYSDSWSTNEFNDQVDLNYEFKVTNYNNKDAAKDLRMMLFNLSRILRRANSYKHDSVTFEASSLTISMTTGDRTFSIASVDDLAHAVIETHKTLKSNCVPHYKFKNSCVTFMWNLCSNVFGFGAKENKDNDGPENGMAAPLLKG